MTTSPQTPRIDINADVGEDPAALARDEAIAKYVTTLNIACGGHAGDESTMRHMLGVAKRLDRTIAAHPSYPDRANFGRAAMAIAPEILADHIAEQVGSLIHLAREVGVRVSRVKPHGALYHEANADPRVCDAIAVGVDRVLPGAPVVAQAGLAAASRWRRQGRAVLEEAFADRTYEPDGTLVARSHAHALIQSPQDAAHQARQIASGAPFRARDGTELVIRADTICIHADTPNALENARAIASVIGDSS